MNHILQKVAQGIKDKSEKYYFDTHINRYQYILAHINKLNLPPKAKILDIGVYPPHLFTALKFAGYHPLGISSAHQPIKHPRIKILNIETQKLPYQEGSIDLVLFAEILEHLSTHPQIIFSHIKKILKPGGLLLLTTPNVTRSQNLFSLILAKNIYFPLDQLNHHPNHRHHREYTLTELSLLFRSSGFKILQKAYFISYSPFRRKNKTDPCLLKLIKFINFLFMLIFPCRRDTLFVLAQV